MIAEDQSSKNTSPLELGLSLAERYRAVRAFSEYLCEPLEVEDYVIQTMPDVSPAKWHLAHTTWFFETFVLAPCAERQYEPVHARYGFLFNSYYNAVGERHCRPSRGLLSRPTVAEVYSYRRIVDERVARLLLRLEVQELERLAPSFELGLHHEQQHQELLLTDLKHVFASNPLQPVYRSRRGLALPNGNGGARDLLTRELVWLEHPGGVAEIGHQGDGFSFDNEKPVHKVWLEPFALADRLVTCGEWLDFMADGGYRRPELWLSDGWTAASQQGWDSPLYWDPLEKGRGDANRVTEGGNPVEWGLMTLHGFRPVERNEPVCHVSFYEADAFARWAGSRLPTEAEWEVVAREHRRPGNVVEGGHYHPVAAGSTSERDRQFFGDVWQWTQSAYSPYPGYQPAPGALGEYNGKFMCNQQVLRGASCATSVLHARATYRNFFPADARWQFLGLRLARDR